MDVGVEVLYDGFAAIPAAGDRVIATGFPIGFFDGGANFVPEPVFGPVFIADGFLIGIADGDYAEIRSSQQRKHLADTFGACADISQGNGIAGSDVTFATEN